MASHVLSSLGPPFWSYDLWAAAFLDLIHFIPPLIPSLESALYFPGNEPSLGRAAGEQKMQHSTRVCMKHSSVHRDPVQGSTKTPAEPGTHRKLPRVSWDLFREHTCTQDFSTSPWDTHPLLEPSSPLSRLLFCLYLSEVLRGRRSGGGLPQLKLPPIP